MCFGSSILWSTSPPVCSEGSWFWCDSPVTLRKITVYWFHCSVYSILSKCAFPSYALSNIFFDPGSQSWYNMDVRWKSRATLCALFRQYWWFINWPPIHISHKVTFQYVLICSGFFYLNCNGRVKVRYISSCDQQLVSRRLCGKEWYLALSTS